MEHKILERLLAASKGLIALHGGASNHSIGQEQEAVGELADAIQAAEQHLTGKPKKRTAAKPAASTAKRSSAKKSSAKKTSSSRKSAGRRK